MQWDDNGDGQLDTNTSTNEATPVVPTQLKLVRDGNTYTGYYSTDGQTWNTVGSATLPTDAAVQDACVFTTSHNADTIGVGDFSGFTRGLTWTPARQYLLAGPLPRPAGKVCKTWMLRSSSA